MALVAGVALAGAGWLLGQRPAPSGGRLIVVDGQDSQQHTAAATAAAPEATSQDLGSAPAPAASDSTAALGNGAAGTPSADTDRAALARQLARRQTAFQACVRQHAADLSEQVQVTLSFDVTASGQVSAASLVPTSLETTRAGHCLLTVARETRFQQLTQPLHFSVPLRARAISR